MQLTTLSFRRGRRAGGTSGASSETIIMAMAEAGSLSTSLTATVCIALLGS
jgi:hypothetical protein